MASINLIFFLFFLVLTTSASPNPILPKSGFISAVKDPSSLQYVAKLSLGDGTAVNLVVDLNSPHVLIHGGGGVPVGSSSLECAMAESVRTNPNSKACSVRTRNPISNIPMSGELHEGKVAFEMWDGVSLTNNNSNNGLAKIDPFLFVKSQMTSNGAKGVLGLGQSRISLMSQIFVAFGFLKMRFSLCLSSISQGGIFLGGSPNFVSKFSSKIKHTPFDYSEDFGGYYVRVNSIKIFDKKMDLQLGDDEPFIAARFSTIAPYTVGPFGTCFVKGGEDGFPAVDLVLQSEMVVWRMDGRDLLVPVGDDVVCLGVVNGGFSRRGFITVGGFQLEDRVLEFDLGNSILGFSDSIGGKTCNDFGFGFDLSEKFSESFVV
ncbi:probable aspartic proteinase GIP2 [Andrographis paniculata]|uniref:probable aspartic proteinase GIP2 n=1 Tax=Andrographis paniculata TaxID=175694 RepID=UPI0021E728DE|nr:probable aspartic proteinase GIP2 [Andrographis paniculata]